MALWENLFTISPVSNAWSLISLRSVTVDTMLFKLCSNLCASPTSTSSLRLNASGAWCRVYEQRIPIPRTVAWRTARDIVCGQLQDCDMQATYWRWEEKSGNKKRNVYLVKIGNLYFKLSSFSVSVTDWTKQFHVILMKFIILNVHSK
jgi:hypothetical protein